MKSQPSKVLYKQTDSIVNNRKFVYTVSLPLVLVHTHTHSISDVISLFDSSSSNGNCNQALRFAINNVNNKVNICSNAYFHLSNQNRLLFKHLRVFLIPSTEAKCSDSRSLSLTLFNPLHCCKIHFAAVLIENGADRIICVLNNFIKCVCVKIL